jgi:hypothetical protein
MAAVCADTLSGKGKEHKSVSIVFLRRLLMTTVTVSDVPVEVTDAKVVEKLREKIGVFSVASFERSSDKTRAKVVCVLPQSKQTQEKLMVEVSSKKNLLWEDIAR